MVHEQRFRNRKTSAAQKKAKIAHRQQQAYHYVRTPLEVTVVLCATERTSGRARRALEVDQVRYEAQQYWQVTVVYNVQIVATTADDAAQQALRSL